MENVLVIGVNVRGSEEFVSKREQTKKKPPFRAKIKKSAPLRREKASVCLRAASDV